MRMFLTTSKVIFSYWLGPLIISWINFFKMVSRTDITSIPISIYPVLSFLT